MAAKIEANIDAVIASVQKYSRIEKYKREFVIDICKGLHK